jgi:hypothetical protein
MGDELTNKIRDNASGPAKASVDGQSMEQHRLSDQIAADRYLASKRATQGNGLGVKTTKLIPPGAA